MLLGRRQSNKPFILTLQYYTAVTNEAESLYMEKGVWKNFQDRALSEKSKVQVIVWTMLPFVCKKRLHVH